MLARWIDRIGEYVAPDENFTTVVQDDFLLAWIAPPPPPQDAFLAQNNKQPPPQDAFALLPDNPNQIRCMHCHRWTDVPNKAGPVNDVGTPGKAPATPQRLPTNVFVTPKLHHKPPGETTEETLNDLIITASKDTAASMVSPPHIRELRDKVFRLCGSTKPLNDKLSNKLRNILKKNPSLLKCRATGLGNLVPDSYTILMAAAYADHVVAGKIILEMAENTSTSILWDTDMHGKTALHIAAQQASISFIGLLAPKYQQDNGIKSPAPVDILGRTPFGSAVTSPNPTARKRRKELEAALFSPGDLSVFGPAKPESERGGQYPELQIAYGIADMPGRRVVMEDAVCAEIIFDQGKKSYCLLGVFDGHGDRGCVSQFVADNLVELLKPHLHDTESTWQQKFQNASLHLDSILKNEGIPGGSTAVIALITDSEIVVANVGDSRAILIQASDTNLEAEMEKLSVKDGKERNSPPLQGEGEKTCESSKSERFVVAMSEDHKPNLPDERTRIEAAGMKVKSVTFEEDGKDVTLHKVALSEKDQLAVSRAFGDFEYKMNPSLPPEEQAVVPVPEVRVHRRDPERDLYLVLGCDGIFDVLDNKQVMNFVLDQVNIRKEITDTVLPEVGDALLRESLNAGSQDNMTVVIAALSKESTGIKSIIKGRTLDFTSP